MNLPHAWVRLPGPADFLETIVEDITDRTAVLAGLPDGIHNAVFAVEIAEAVKRRGLGRWEAVRHSEPYEITPSESLSRRRNGVETGGLVLWVDAMNGDAAAKAWADHARLFAESEESPRICIAMRTACAETCREDKRLRRRLWRDFVTALDSRVLMERLGRRFGRSPGHIALKSALVAELAGPDLAFAERVGEESLGRILDSGKYPSERIWAAQVGILFPIVERERRRLLDVHPARWDLPHIRDDGTKIDCKEDLEVGDMAFQAKKWDESFKAEKSLLKWLRYIRNTLAHNEIVPWGTLISPTAREIVDFRE